MANAAADVVEMTQGVPLAAYLAERMRQLAVERAVEIIGEAARQVGESVRTAAPEIPWRLIVAQRNILAHDYGAVDPERMWRLALHEIPALIDQLKPLIAKLESES